MKQVLQFVDGHLLTKNGIVQQSFWMKGSKIVSPQKIADQTVSAKNLLIAPGYIDLQINGGFGIDCTSTPHLIGELAKKLPQFGITAFLPTIITSSLGNYKRIFSEPLHLERDNKEECDKAEILGYHLEGPFFHPDYTGAHNPHWVSEIKEIGNFSQVKIVTLAPELKGAEMLIAELKKKGILIAAGHTNAKTLEGVDLVTHLFNSMRRFHHRDSGIIGAILGEAQLPFTLIVDDKHLDDNTIKIAWKCHPGGVILISDGISGMGMQDGIYPLGDREVQVKQQRACIVGTEKLAGSVVSLDKAVQRFKTITGCSVQQAIELASTRPAQLLGLTDKGVLREGADADFILLDHDLIVQSVYIKGNRIV